MVIGLWTPVECDRVYKNCAHDYEGDCYDEDRCRCGGEIRQGQCTRCGRWM